jgi:hypothetical protein
VMVEGCTAVVVLTGELCGRVPARWCGPSRLCDVHREDAVRWADLCVSEERERLARAGLVYYARQPSGLIKIGTSTKVRSRVRQIERDEGCSLVILATEPGGRRMESQRHGEFKDYRVKGEWFKPGARLLRWIHALEVQRG